MKNFFLTHKFDPGDQKNSQEKIQESVHPFPQEINITDGGEFLDDGIRMRDQPYCESDVSEDE